MTLQEAKELAAKGFGYPSFKYALNNSGAHGMQSIMDKAAKLYARSKWDEACEAYERKLIELDKVYLVNKPEFKP